MKIIQLIVVEDNGVQGLGDDGKLYDLRWQAASFGRYNKQWVIAEGLQPLATAVSEYLTGSTVDSVKTRLTAFANKRGLYGNSAQHANEDVIIRTLKAGSEAVVVTQYPNTLAIHGSDDSRVQLNLTGNQYV